MDEAWPLVVLGTTNAGKLRELIDLLGPLGIRCRSLTDEPRAVVVEETGSSFAENAALKASAQARAIGAWVLAEDSGLVVDALDGAPGIYSARFAGAAATDATNNALLLERLARHRGAARSAHYACHAALADPGGAIVATSSGTCSGIVAETASGASRSTSSRSLPAFVVPSTTSGRASSITASHPGPGARRSASV